MQRNGFQVVGLVCRLSSPMIYSATEEFILEVALYRCQITITLDYFALRSVTSSFTNSLIERRRNHVELQQCEKCFIVIIAKCHLHYSPCIATTTTTIIISIIVEVLVALKQK